MEEPAKQLRFALEKYPERVEVAPLRDLLIDSAREKPNRPAYVKLAVPDAIVKALRGVREQRDLVLLVRVPGEIQQRADSPIVLPGEV